MEGNNRFSEKYIVKLLTNIGICTTIVSVLNSGYAKLYSVEVKTTEQFASTEVAYCFSMAIQSRWGDNIIRYGLDGCGKVNVDNLNLD